MSKKGKGKVALKMAILNVNLAREILVGEYNISTSVNWDRVWIAEDDLIHAASILTKALREHYGKK